ncbi:AraC family transcriptional regulator [Dyadobacter arcticus]|uniref:AraC-like DNA-binding protein n=1 Tax=Dyadobacter arcticus TaxID=1078754 RepID=A0ABX0UJ12_9BACT|nr:AraC family transcriptional regulator [Dyadobacter arcticus]NIJ52998.1 AraC-like DNA-binding protein [Dyadobacter arcticus]
MHVQNLFQPFEVRFVKVDECPVKAHKNTFIELVYILEGKGIYHIDEHQFKYGPENLFLTMPMHMHFTEVSETTSFVFIRFNNIYLNAQKAQKSYSNLGDWIEKLEYIFHNSNHLQGCILRNMSDKPLVRAVIKAIVIEYQSQQTMHKELVQQLLNTLLMVVARNISLHLPEKSKVTQNTSLDIIHYIHLNIYNSEKLKAESIASRFHISLNYISEFFKKHTNENLQQYIINYKLALVEIRLTHSDMRLNEIASELGFTDDSHLTKMFKKYKGIPPSEYRRSTAVTAQ